MFRVSCTFPFVVLFFHTVPSAKVTSTDFGSKILSKNVINDLFLKIWAETPICKIGWLGSPQKVTKICSLVRFCIALSGRSPPAMPGYRMSTQVVLAPIGRRFPTITITVGPIVTNVTVCDTSTIASTMKAISR